MEWILVGIILLYLGWEKLGPQRSTLSWFWVAIIAFGAVVAAYSLT